jgi:hypothetical protein
MGLSARALITVTEARNYLRDSEADQGELEDRINAYSVAIENYCGRQFSDGGAGVTKIFDYPGMGHLDFFPFEARAITSVTVVGEGAGGVSTLLVSATDYMARPRGKSPEGTYFWLDAPMYTYLYGRPVARFGWRIDVLGDWGMQAVPEDVAMACKVCVSDSFRNPEGYASRSVMGVIGEEVGPGAVEISRHIPDDAKGLLEGFMRWAPILAP